MLPLILVAALLTASPVGASAQSDAGTRGATLNVPYVPQTRLLCGGAAVVMVMRYWGARDVQPTDFGSLVNEREGGIQGAALATTVARLGWDVRSTTGTVDDLQDRIVRGQPVVVLLGDEDRGHFVTVVGWDDEAVVVHDPAARPFLRIPYPHFAASWARSAHWALAILPALAEAPESGGGPLQRRGTPTVEAVKGNDCPGVDEGIRLAKAGQLGEAVKTFEAALRACPASASAMRELAGVEFLRSRWNRAAELAERAVARDAHDARAWRLFATALYLNEDEERALRAWNTLEEPRLDFVRTTGAIRTRRPAIAVALGLTPRDMLTPGTLRHARRRLASLPTTSASRIGYRVLPGGLAELDVALVERPVVSSGWPALAMLAVNAFSNRAATWHVSSPTGAGEMWSLSWRWWRERPRLGLSYAVPRPVGLPGIWQIEGFWERQTYASTPSPQPSPPLRGEGGRSAGEGATAAGVSTRRHAGLSVSDWITGDVRWTGSIALDRWSRGSRGATTRRFVAVGGAIEVRPLADRFALQTSATAWSGLGHGAGFGTGALRAGWQSATGPMSVRWIVTGALEGASVGAPADVWPGAGTGDARTASLRAHPLLAGGVVMGKGFGRALASGGLERQAPLDRAGRLRWAAFLDAARAWHGRVAEGPAFLLDAGAGIRVMLPSERHAVRVDVARGLRDRAFSLRVGYEAPWPGW